MQPQPETPSQASSDLASPSTLGSPTLHAAMTKPASLGASAAGLVKAMTSTASFASGARSGLGGWIVHFFRENTGGAYAEGGGWPFRERMSFAAGLGAAPKGGALILAAAFSHPGGGTPGGDDAGVSGGAPVTSRGSAALSIWYRSQRLRDERGVP